MDCSCELVKISEVVSRRSSAVRVAVSEVTANDISFDSDSEIDVMALPERSPTEDEPCSLASDIVESECDESFRVKSWLLEVMVSWMLLSEAVEDSGRCRESRILEVE